LTSWTVIAVCALYTEYCRNRTAVKPAPARRLFAAGAGGWTLRQSLSAPAERQYLGDQVVISSDGRVIAAGVQGLAGNTPGLRRNHRAGAEPVPGSPGSPTTAAIYFYEPAAQGQWERTAATALATDSPGAPISLSADGTVYAAGLMARRGLGDPPASDRVVVY
jgi:hypothetical protein